MTSHRTSRFFFPEFVAVSGTAGVCNWNLQRRCRAHNIRAAGTTAYINPSQMVIPPQKGDKKCIESDVVGYHNL